MSDSYSLCFEFLFVDDGSKDQTLVLLREFSKKDNRVKYLSFSRNFGKEAAIYAGLEYATGNYVAIMDADMQDSPDEIPALYQMIMSEDYDMISGWKKKRFDPKSKTIPTKLFNATARKFSGIHLHDFNCGLKAYKNKVVKSIEVYGEMHRYIPILAQQAGFTKIGEKVVQHRARKYGVTKFGGLNRFINGMLDLLSITFITRFAKKPMHLFGAIGTLLFIIGFCAAGWIGIDKLICLSQGIRARLVTDNPYFYISLVCMILGTQLFLAGFVAELVSRSATDRNVYLIEKEI